MFEVFDFFLRFRRRCVADLYGQARRELAQNDQPKRETMKKVSVQEARQRLAKVGIELGPARSANTGSKTRFQVTTPVGTTVYLQPREVATMLREIDNAAAV